MVKYLENTYSFRYPTSLVSKVAASGGPDAATLSQIESLLSQASQSYWGRQYQDAINAYQQAGTLIYQYLDPSAPVHVVGIYGQLSKNPALFTSLLSVAAEYMNVLPPETPEALRPSTPPDASALGTPSFDTTGIRSSALSTPSAAQAFADAQTAQRLRNLGMTQTATLFDTRASSLDATVAKLFVSPAPATGTAAVSAPQNTVAGATISPAVSEVPKVQVLTPEIDKIAIPITTLPVSTVPVAIKTATRSVGVSVAGKVVSITWNVGDSPATAQLQSSVYAARASLTMLPDILLAPQQPSDVALALPHDYYYEIPLGLAECYHALGDYANAETYYLQAANYQYLNSAVEAPFVWIGLANLYLDWGDSLFKGGDPTDALPIYSKVLTIDMKAPTSQLYTLAGLKPAWTVAQQIITNLSTVTTLSVNPQIAAVIVDVRQQLLKIAAGLDFWGVWAPSVPIWTFDYLQQVAINFAQLAISAEQSVISFWNNADQSTLTLQQLTDNVAQSKAEATAAQMQLSAAQAQTQVYSDGVTLAQQRATDAQNNVTEYASLSNQWNMHSALQAQLNGGDDGDASALNAYASQMMSGSYSLSGSSATLAAAEGLTSARLNQQYEVDSMNRQAQELQAATTQAKDELTAATAQQNAAQAQLDAANLRTASAAADVAAFDAQTFTPDVWSRMGNTMLKIYQRYFKMALKVARMMQQAYNFETDQSLQLIKSSYASDEVSGLLGADALMADIQGFTYNLITSTTTKPQPIKQTISLAQRYGYAFESQFRKTGAIDFQTTFDDFEMVYPGTYSGRIQEVEVAIQGIVPPTGVSGSLTNSGISMYRLPSANWTTANSGVKYRVQSKETLVLSDYSPRTDAVVIQTDPGMMRIFEGAGVCSTWHLEFPRSENDIDFGSITDVQMTIVYKARYDPTLSSKVIAALAGRPGVAAQQRGIPLRWVYPDAFYAFQNSGTMTISFAQRDFPFNQRSPVITSIGVVVATVGGLSASGLKVQLASPTHTTAVSAPTDANGIIDSSVASSPWATLASGTALGAYTIAMTASDNPSLVQSGKLSLAGIGNIALVLGYSYTPRS
jgi:hypothetical protein